MNSPLRDSLSGALRKRSATKSSLPTSGCSGRSATRMCLNDQPQRAGSALRFYGQQGDLDEPEEFFAAPPPPTEVTVRPLKTRGRSYERIVFDSGYEPKVGTGLWGPLRKSNAARRSQM